MIQVSHLSHYLPSLCYRTLTHPLQESCLLAQLGDVGTVIVGEHLVAQDGVRHLNQM